MFGAINHGELQKNMQLNFFESIESANKMTNFTFLLLYRLFFCLQKFDFFIFTLFMTFHDFASFIMNFWSYNVEVVRTLKKSKT